MALRTTFVTLLVTIMSAGSAAAQDTRKISDISPSSRALLTVDDDHRAAALQPSPRRDSRWNGILIGAITGAAGGALLGMGVAHYCDNEARDCSNAVPAGGVVGGVVGGFLGAAIDDAIGNSISSPRPRLHPSVRFSVRF